MKPWLIVSLLLTVLVLAATGYVWTQRADWLPEQVPVHWGLNGEPDRFVPRDEMLPTLLMLPCTMVLMIGLALVLPWLSPANFKIDSFRESYDWIMLVVIAMMGYLSVVILLANAQRLPHMERWLIGGILIALGAMGNVMGKIQRNFYVGIRTPWTLASETVWIATHRLAAWLLVAAAVVGLGLILTPLNAFFAMIPLLLAAIIPAIYSLILYKRLEREGKLVIDQDKT
jgi:uncharacterized membrane protein